MAGRIEIDDVAARGVRRAVSRPRPSSARSCRSRPRCGARATTPWRPHWWCATTARAYPQLARRPPGRRAAQPVPIETVVTPSTQDQAAAAADGARAARPTCSTASSSPTASGCGRSGWTAGATRSRPGARPSPPSSTPARARPNCPTTCWSGARCSSAPPPACPRRTALSRCIDAAARLREPGDPFTRAGAALAPRGHRPARAVSAARTGHPRRAIRRLGGPAAGPVQRLVRDVPAVHRRLGQRRATPVHGTFATAAKALPRIAKMGFDVVYLPPIHPIGKVHRKGRNNTRDRRAQRRRLAVGDRQRRGRPRRRAPRAGHHRGLRRLRRRRARPGSGGGAGPGAAVRARPSVGQGSIRSGSPCCPTAPSPTRRTRRRSTRTSIR